MTLKANIRRGKLAEQEIVRLLEAGKFYAVRIPTSGTEKIPDIVASRITKKMKLKVAISVKSSSKHDKFTRSTWKKDNEGITNFAENFDMVPLAIGRFPRRKIRVMLFDQAIADGMYQHNSVNFYRWLLHPNKPPESVYF